MVITSADVTSSAIQWDDLSEIRDLFAVPLKLLWGPLGGCGPKFENTELAYPRSLRG